MRANAQRPTITVSPYDGGSLTERFSDRTAGQKIVKILGTQQNWVLDTRAGKLHTPTR